MAILTDSGKIRIYRIDGNNLSLIDLYSLIQDNSINPGNFTRAKLYYRVGQKNEYPLKFISKNMEVWISSVRPGFKKDGSKNIISALFAMGFKLGKDDKEKILCHKNVDVIFCKSQL